MSAEQVTDLSARDAAEHPFASDPPPDLPSVDDLPGDDDGDHDAPFDDPVLHTPLHELEVEDDGLHAVEDERPPEDSCLSDNGNFGDREEEHIGADAYVWKIDRRKGHHHLRADQFLATVRDPYFDGSRAIEMLQQRYTIDYGSRKTGSRPAGAAEEYHPLFFLDMLIVVGRPLHAISQVNERFFDNITVSFKHWRASYQAKHIHGFQFSLQHRTFRIATAATRESWFIVMHPRGHVMTELPSSHRDHRRRQDEATASSALRPHHAEFLATYIKQVFHVDQLLGEGVEASWRLDGAQSQKITFTKWTIFQQCFMSNWEAHVAENTADPFWQQHLPAFHAYDYGANIEIVANEFVQNMPPESSIRPDRDDESDSDSEAADDGGLDNSLSFADNSLFSPGEVLDDLMASVDADNPSTTPTEAIRPRLEPLHAHTPEDRAPLELPARSTVSPRRQSSSSLPLDAVPSGLQQLHDELAQKYLLHHLQSISFALAVDINCLATDSNVDSNGRQAARCLLADRNLVSREFRGARDFNFFPLGFHPAYGNFSSARPPSFLDDRVLAVMRDNLSYLNDGTDPLTFGFFQAYSNIKRSIRHSPDDLLATKGIATGALTLSEDEARASHRLQAKRAQLRRQLLGELSPHDPDATRPFARERRRLEAAQDGEEYAFRMEQVVHVQLDRLLPSLRQFTTVLQPILQIMRFFIQEPLHYTSFLRSFPSTVFPAMLTGFAHLFDKALCHLRERIDQRGSHGASAALAEGVAALDRLGSYCFTGFPRSLMSSVLRPLGTIESIASGGWPFIDAELLNLITPSGTMNMSRWPRGLKDRPLLMHVTALKYHYGVIAAESRHNHVWFHELGGCDLSGPSGITKFLQDFFESLWVPQMVAFVSHQVDRALREQQRHHEFVSTSILELEVMHQRRELLEAWKESSRPFAWCEYQSLWQKVITLIGNGPVVISSKARQDYSHELYQYCRGTESRGGGAGLASVNATWLSVLRRIVDTVPLRQVSTEHWVAALSAATLAQGIDCMPGVCQSRLSSRRVVRLIGYATPLAILSAPVGSLKRAALEAQHRSKRICIQRRIDLGSSLPFTDIPALIQNGFDGLERQFQRGDQRVLEHYRVARNCLQSCLGSPEGDLLLMLVMTLASCSVTPAVLPNTKEFTASATRRDPGSFAASLTTRMLWFLRPTHFPWQEDWPKILRVAEMTKKLEHKGVHNRLLRHIGWVKVVAGNRDSPRNADLQLEDTGTLMQTRKTMLALMKDPAGFVRFVFQSHDPIWLDRCSQIVRIDE